MPVIIGVLLAIAIVLGALIIRDGLFSVSAELQEIREKPWPPLGEEFSIDNIAIDRIMLTPLDGEERDAVNVRITGPFYIRPGEGDQTDEGEVSLPETEP